MGERWRDIHGWPGYQVSNFGRVRSLARLRPHNCYKDHMMLWPGRILKLGRQTSGHLHVTLTGQRTVRVHRLVAIAFISAAPFRGALVRHRDDNPENNHYRNLQWGTQKQNLNDAKRNGAKLGGYRPKGSKCVRGVFV